MEGETVVNHERDRGADLLAADEQPVALLERDDLAALERGRILPARLGREPAPLLLDRTHQSSVNSSGDR